MVGEFVFKLPWIGIAIVIYGIIVLACAIATCPAKHASVSASIFMMLGGIAFLLGKDLEKTGKR